MYFLFTAVITIGLESNSYTAVEGTPLEVCAAVEQGTFGLNSTELGNTTFDVNILTFNLYSYSYTNTGIYGASITFSTNIVVSNLIILPQMIMKILIQYWCSVQETLGSVS